MMDSANATASDLWQQVFSRLAERDDAALTDPTYDPTEDLARIRAGYRAAGWSDAEIQAFHEKDRERLVDAPVTSPGVNTSAELFLGTRCDEVEVAMTRLGLDSHHRIARGIQPVIGPGAGLTNVVMTDESIVTVDAHTFRFCGLVAKAVTRTIHIDPTIWDSRNYDVETARVLIRHVPKLMAYWMQIFFSYALTGTNILVDFLPAMKTELIVYEQIARAMEIFMISHEYGHHHLRHGRSIETDFHKEEYEADQFALKICYELARDEKFGIPDPYLASGGGGILLLLGLSAFKKVRAKLGFEIPRGDTHPAADLRIRRFDSVAVMKPIEFQTLKGFRSACERIMSLIDLEIVDNPSIDWTRLREIAAAVQRPTM